MQGAFRESKRKDGTGRIFYRCVIQRSRALPEDFEHPPSVYVRQEPIITQLNDWIGTLADPASLAAGDGDDGGGGGATAASAADLRRRIREVEAKLANLVASIEAGIDPTMIAPQMATRTAERNELQSRLRQLLTAKRASVQQVEDENFFGGIAPMLAKATPGELLEIYTSMQLKLIYLPASKTVKAQVNAGACENVRVRGGT